MLENVLQPNPAAWSRVIDLMKATELEARVVMAYEFMSEPLLTDRVLLILGEVSPKFIRDSWARFLEVYPKTSVTALEGQGHTAQATAPELLAQTIRNYLDPRE
jgi:pimeloyl-ACP methyl ester carboxylesterase